MQKDFGFSFDKSLRLDEMEYSLLSLKSINPHKVFQIRSEVESVYVGKHINNDKLIEFIQKNNNHFFIVSNNLHATILSNIIELGILYKFKKIVGCDTIFNKAIHHFLA